MMLGQWQAILGPFMQAIGGASTVPTYNPQGTPASSGPSTGEIVGIGVVGLGVIGLITYLVMRRRA